MLAVIRIQNLALVDQLVWEVGRGLVGVTGETGAGKSVIVGALKLVLGERADKGLIRTGESACTVEAVFDLAESSAVDAVLEEAGLAPCEDGQLIIRRVVGERGNRQFVNDSPATLTLLKSLAERLVDLHGPGEQQSLHSIERQLGMLDAYADGEAPLRAYRQAWREFVQARDAYQELRSSEEAGDAELELLRHKQQEIEAADIRLEEIAGLEERYQQVSNGARLGELAGEVVELLSGESGVVNRLGDLQRLAHELERLDGGNEDRFSGLESALLELEEIESSVRDYLEELEMDPAEARELEERVDLLESLKRKYGPTLEDVVATGEAAAARLDSLENRGERLAELQQALERAREKVQDSGKALSRLRKRAAPRLSKEVKGHLRDLGFKQAEFEAVLQKRKEAGPNGLEDVEFQFGPNPGEPLKPLRKVGSSGELARVMLAVKSALAEKDATPLMVFDEIDANVGGEVAAAVGRKMAALGEAHQVVSITHFPQVAAVAAHHYLVEKVVEKGRTFSRLREVQAADRIAELVRMLGGGGQEAESMARKLLETN
ncbi:DNA repair protein RecN [Roseibacillus ishigakijimensis]|uniref:DNA repair protein RecN n=1 Tax=Roseibacillus ishigakijimensis TaxID=454146 RepID=A0A934RS53_9BACT|nr:DNA repair protein RecN [Roseibacillus ishigakijimensis]MBK1834024.1 DNA repair protein RecN [Roseibacillus ishigakijimensis]